MNHLTKAYTCFHLNPQVSWQTLLFALKVIQNYVGGAAEAYAWQLLEQNFHYLLMQILNQLIPQGQYLYGAERDAT